MKKHNFQRLAKWALLCLIPLIIARVCAAADTSIAGQYLHVFTWVTDYADATGKQHLCSPPGTGVNVQLDDGTTLTVTIEKLPKVPDTKPSTCADGPVSPGVLYTVARKNIVSTSYTSESFVTGVLAVPFKFHISSRATTAGSTIGSYLGYRFGVKNWFTFTPIVGGGLALVSTQSAQVTTPGSSTPSPSTQTSTGFSLAIGAIGSVSNTGAGAQFGVVFGLDWLGKSSNYQYNGKLWLAFEIGYNFSQ